MADRKTHTKVRRTADEWLAEINSGLAFRKLFGLEDAWADLEAKFFSVSPSADTAPNLSFSKGDAIVAGLGVPDVYVVVTPLSERAALSAPAVESLANQIVRETDLSIAFDEALCFAFLFGVGPIKLGFDSEYGYDESLKLPGIGGTTVQVNDDGDATESGRARLGRPWASAVDPRDVVVPWGTKDIRYASQVFHRLVRSAKDVREDPRYTNTTGLRGTVSLKGVTLAYSQVRDSTEQTLAQAEVGGAPQPKDEQEYIELWEIMDRESRRVIIIAVGATEDDKQPAVRIIRDEPNTLQINGVLPWIDVCITHRTRAFWVTPLSWYIRPHQIELDDIYAQAKEQRRASVLKLLLAAGVLSAEARQNLLNGKVGMVVEVDLNKFPDQQLSSLCQYIGANPGMNVLLHQEADVVADSARETTGLSRMAMGEFDSKNRRTATEASFVNEGGDVRLGRKQLSIRRSYRRAVEILLAILARHWETPQAVLITGDDGVSQWTMITAEILNSGRFAFNISFSTEYYDSPMRRQQQALALYSQLSADPRIDQDQLLGQMIDAFNVPGLKKLQPQAAAPGASNAAVRVPVSGGASNRAPAAGGGSLQPPRL